MAHLFERTQDGNTSSQGSGNVLSEVILPPPDLSSIKVLQPVSKLIPRSRHVKRLWKLLLAPVDLLTYPGELEFRYRRSSPRILAWCFGRLQGFDDSPASRERGKEMAQVSFVDVSLITAPCHLQFAFTSKPASVVRKVTIQAKELIDKSRAGPSSKARHIFCTPHILIYSVPYICSCSVVALGSWRGWMWEVNALNADDGLRTGNRLGRSVSAIRWAFVLVFLRSAMTDCLRDFTSYTPRQLFNASRVFVDSGPLRPAGALRTASEQVCCCKQSCPEKD